jgi:hypothetical protein
MTESGTYPSLHQMSHLKRTADSGKTQNELSLNIRSLVQSTPDEETGYKTRKNFPSESYIFNILINYKNSGTAIEFL